MIVTRSVHQFTVVARRARARTRSRGTTAADVHQCGQPNRRVARARPTKTKTTVYTIYYYNNKTMFVYFGVCVRDILSRDRPPVRAGSPDD